MILANKSKNRFPKSYHLINDMISAACSPVLLPGRVVQALNLNVHALGLQVSPHKGLICAEFLFDSPDYFLLTGHLC